MKATDHKARDLAVSNKAQDRGGQFEVDSFLNALKSYPDRFAREPQLSFQNICPVL
jgi:hypothetical protein